MKDNLSVFKIWAPDQALWVAWTKPVLFAGAPRDVGVELNIPELNWVPPANRRTAIVVDLPGKQAVEQGLALAQLGYRPVALFNGVEGPNVRTAVVDVSGIAAALRRGAQKLAVLNLHHNAPPAFLLDSERMRDSKKTPGNYDNRWCVFPQDMPSASFLRKNNVDTVVVRTAEIRNDLSHILRRYQEQNIKIRLCDESENLRDIVVPQPSRFKALAYRFLTVLGLRRNATGGFGGMIPDPEAGGGYYGIG